MKNGIGKRNRALMVTGCGVLALCLSGCLAGSTRKLSWNGLYTGQGVSLFNLGEVALLNLCPKTITSFRAIYYTPEPGSPVITIRMPDGKFIPANNLNRDTLAPYIAAGTTSDYQTSIDIYYSRGIVNVSFDKHGNPKQVVVRVDRRSIHSEIQGEPPAISTPDGTAVLEFPLREKELKNLLGKPTDDHRETYIEPLTV
jgi:hypothetical protein